MSDQPKQSKGLLDKVVIGTVIMAAIAALVILSQPVWRGEEMVAELKSDCAKRGGIMLEHEKAFGKTYECASRLD